MGQGQEVHARRLMTQMIQNGGWLLLQNCHLSLDYIYEIFDQIVETEHIHEDFRLWVTTEVHLKFPINFLQVTQVISDCGLLQKSTSNSQLTFYSNSSDFRLWVTTEVHLKFPINFL